MSLHPPRILPPVATGDGTVWVSGVSEGATVVVRQGGTTRGQRVADGPVVAVPVTGVSGAVHPVARSGAEDSVGPEVTPVEDPGGAGEFPRAARRDVDYGGFEIPEYAGDGGFTTPLAGRVWLPADDDGRVPDQLGRRPLVLIAPGYWADPADDEKSYQGYAWLAEHLARWGMVACAVDLWTVNRETIGSRTQQWARGEVIVAMLERLIGDPDLAGAVDRGRIGLVGHSMGGEGVVTAQAVNRARRLRLGIRGVASLAPTNHRPDVAATHTAYLQLHGSLDYLLSLSDEEFSGLFGGPRLYDRAWRPRAFGWLRGARHEGWNPLWLASPLSLEPDPEPGMPVLPEQRQHEIGQALLTAFLLDTLVGRVDYRGYLAGPPRPRALEGEVVHRQYQSPSVELVDDFGDPNPQFGLPGEEPPDRTVNRRGERARASGAAVDEWRDVDHRTLELSVHATHGLDLAWRGDDVGYDTDLDGVEVGEADVLSFRVAQYYAEDAAGDPDETWNPVGEDLDPVVELVDGGGRRAALPLSVIAPVPYPLPGFQTYSVFRTVRLPVDAFTAVEPRLDLTALKQVRLRMTGRATGRLLVDDIEFETAPLTVPSTVTMLRVHDLHGGYGPPDDHIDGELVTRVSGAPDHTVGATLRTDSRLPSHEGMLALLRDGLVHRDSVRTTIDYDLDTENDRRNGRLMRVELRPS